MHVVDHTIQNVITLLIVLNIFLTKLVSSSSCDSKRIVGGQSITDNDSPFNANWLVGISMGCGGVWIDENTILTAAHCFPNRDLHQGDIWQIYKKNDLGKQEFLANVTGGNVIVHENFNQFSMVNDIALVKVCENQNVGAHEIIKLPDNLDFQFESFFVYGWGTMQHGEDSVPEILQWVETPYKRVGNNCLKK